MIIALSGLALAGQGIDWVTLPHHVDGGIAAVVRVEPGTDPDDLSARVDGELAALQARSTAEDGLVTVLSFDGSGSFEPYTERAFQVARTLELGPQDRAGVMVFGRQARHWDVVGDRKVLQEQLTEARALAATEKETRLAAFLLTAIDRAADAPDAGDRLRRVIVFTDAGEESEVFPPEEVIERARSRRVVVDAVVFARPGARSFAEDLDRLARITRSTGGSLLEVHGAETPSLPATELLPYLTIHAESCGVETATLELFGPDGLHTDPTSATGAPTPCDPAASTPPAPPVETEPQHADAPLPRPDRLSGLLCLLLLVGILGLVGVGIWRLAIREPTPAPPRPSPPKPPLPETPTATPAPMPVQSPSVDTPGAAPYAPSFEHKLPETHLEVVTGALAGTRWRFAGRKLRLGAVEEENDVVVDLPQVSGHHAVFELFPSGAVFVEDLASANGTFVDGRRLAPGERVDVSTGQRIDLSAQLSLIVRPGGQA